MSVLHHRFPCDSHTVSPADREESLADLPLVGVQRMPGTGLQNPADQLLVCKNYAPVFSYLQLPHLFLSITFRLSTGPIRKKEVFPAFQQYHHRFFRPDSDLPNRFPVWNRLFQQSFKSFRIHPALLSPRVLPVRLSRN